MTVFGGVFAEENLASDSSKEYVFVRIFGRPSGLQYANLTRAKERTVTPFIHDTAASFLARITTNAITNNEITRRVPSSKIVAASAPKREIEIQFYTRIYIALEAKPHKVAKQGANKSGAIAVGRLAFPFNLNRILNSAWDFPLASTPAPSPSRLTPLLSLLSDSRGKYPIIYIPRIQRTLISAGNRESRNRKTNRKLEN